jgi:hypothetical protein
LIFGCRPEVNETGLNKPVLEAVGTAVHRLGTVEANTSFDEVFELINVTSQEIRLSSEVQTSCGCSKAELTKKVVAPGGKANVILHIAAPGVATTEQRVRGVLFSEDQRPLMTVQVAFPVSMPWSIAPASLTFVGLPGSRHTAVGWVHGNLDGNVQMVGMRTDFPGIEFQWDKAATVLGADVRFDVVCTLPKDVGTYSGKVEVMTDHTRTPSQAIPIRLNVVQDVACSPPEVLISLQHNNKVNRALDLISAKPFMIRSSSCTLDGIEINLEPTVTKSRQTVRIICDPNQFRAGMAKGVIEFVVDTENGTDVAQCRVIVFRRE